MIFLDSDAWCKIRDATDELVGHKLSIAGAADYYRMDTKWEWAPDGIQLTLTFDDPHDETVFRLKFL